LKEKHYNKCSVCGGDTTSEDKKPTCEKCSKEAFNQRMKNIEWYNNRSPRPTEWTDKTVTLSNSFACEITVKKWLECT
jgi:hypothetical protein